MSKNLKNKTLLLLLAILLLGAFLRLYKITSDTLYGDELTMVYDSYSLLRTGHDQVGKLLPLTFTMGAGRPAGYVYGSIPFVALFGPSILGVRMLSVLSGLGIVLLMFCLGKKLFSKEVGLAAAFLICISPWELSLSRGGFEAHFALFLSLLGIVSYLYAKEKPKLYLLSALSFGLALNTYPTYKLTLPLLLIAMAGFSGGIKNLLLQNKYIKYAVGLALLLSLVAYSQSFLRGSEERFLAVNVFAQKDLKQKIIQEINIERSLDQLPIKLQLVFHNKIEKYFTLLRDTYTKNLSPEFLFLKGDGNPRHNMSVTGEFYFVEILLIFAGIIYLAKKDSKSLKLLLFWVLIVPIATIPLLQEHALRNSFMLPPLTILSSLGLVVIIKNKNYLVFTAIFLVWLIQFAYVLERIYFLSPNKFASFWAYPAYQAANIAIENKDKYDYIFLSDKIDAVEYSYPVYATVNPDFVISQNEERSVINNLRFKQFDNVYIGSFPQGVEVFEKKLDGSKLFVLDYSEKGNINSYDTIDSIDKSHSLVVKSVK